MRRSLAFAVALGSTVVLAGLAPAQEQKKRERPKAAEKIDSSLFDRLDVNKDGVITLDEIPEQRREMVKRFIERFDKNGDGKLTREEFEAGLKEFRAQADRAETNQRGERPPGAAPAGERRPDAPGRPDEPGRPAEPGRPGAPLPAGDPQRQQPFGRPGFGAGVDLFRFLDTDGDGKLSRDELAKAAERLMKFDKNGDGFLTPDEIAEGIRDLIASGGFRPAGPNAAPRPPDAPGGARPSEAAPRRPGEPASDPATQAGGIFRRLDKNGDGKLSKDELPALMRDRFEQMDTNKDGFVDETEFAQALERFRRARAENPVGPAGPFGGFFPGGPDRPPNAGDLGANRERVAAFLREYDKDADGRVSLKEFGEDRAEEFKKLDLNGDGFLTPDELARALPAARDGDRATDRPRRDAPRDSRKDDKPKDQ